MLICMAAPFPDQGSRAKLQTHTQPHRKVKRPVSHCSVLNPSNKGGQKARSSSDADTLSRRKQSLVAWSSHELREGSTRATPHQIDPYKCRSHVNLSVKDPVVKQAMCGADNPGQKQVVSSQEQRDKVQNIHGDVEAKPAISNEPGLSKALQAMRLKAELDLLKLEQDRRFRDRHDSVGDRLNKSHIRRSVSQVRKRDEARKWPAKNSQEGLIRRSFSHKADLDQVDDAPSLDSPLRRSASLKFDNDESNLPQQSTKLPENPDAKGRINRGQRGPPKPARLKRFSSLNTNLVQISKSVNEDRQPREHVSKRSQSLERRAASCSTPDTHLRLRDELPHGLSYLQPDPHNRHEATNATDDCKTLAKQASKTYNRISDHRLVVRACRLGPETAFGLVGLPRGNRSKDALSATHYKDGVSNV